MSAIVSDLLDLGVRVPGGVTAGANLAAHSLVDLAGTIPSSAADCTGGVVVADTASGDLVDVKMGPGIYAVYATDTVTAGLMVEAYQLASTIYANISGTSTAVTITGVKNISSGYVIGRALTSGVAGDLVLVNMSVSPSK
jgi:hypothetical protein